MGKRDKIGICEKCNSRCGKIRLNLINKVKIVIKKSFKRILFNMNIHLSNMTIIKKLNVTNAIKK